MDIIIDEWNNREDIDNIDIVKKIDTLNLENVTYEYITLQIHLSLMDNSERLEKFFIEWLVVFKDVSNCLDDEFLIKNGHVSINKQTDNINLSLFIFERIFSIDGSNVDDMFNFTWDVIKP